MAHDYNTHKHTHTTGQSSLCLMLKFGLGREEIWKRSTRNGDIIIYLYKIKWREFITKLKIYICIPLSCHSLLTYQNELNPIDRPFIYNTLIKF